MREAPGIGRWRRWGPLGALLLATACGGTAPFARLDVDHDGWIAPADCDDRDPRVHPEAVEECNGRDDDCDGEVDQAGAVGALPYYRDRDGDGHGTGPAVLLCAAPQGYARDATDCDDTDPAVHPDAPERCNGLDDDCDGLLDEDGAIDAPRWYLDGDGDGHGEPDAWLLACEAPSGTSAWGDDCDDGDPEVHPDAPERCSPPGRDEDCDGLVDEEDDSLVDAVESFADLDGDGWGQGEGMTRCEVPAGRATLAGDCADADPAVHPGAEERCADGQDNDCDGLIDDEDPDHGPLRTLYLDADGDGFGDPTRALEADCRLPSGASAEPLDCDDADPAVSPAASERWYDGVDQDCDGADDFDADGDGEAASATGGRDCRDDDPEIHPGQPEQCADGEDNDCDGMLDPCAPWVWSAEAGSRLGAALWAGPDLDGDGWPELAAGADRGGEAHEGRVRLLGGSSGRDEGPTLRGSEAGAYLGAALAGGEGLLAVGAPGAGASSGGSDGAVYLLAAPLAEGEVESLACGRWSGTSGEGAGGGLTAPGDLDDDGIPDLAIGAPAASGAGTRAGRVGLVSLRCGEDADLDQAARLWLGSGAYAAAGAILAGAGDTDGDGLPELLIGMPEARGAGDYAGSFALVGVEDEGGSLEDARAVLHGEAASDQFGAALAAAGDLDGDGYGDIAVGAPGSDRAGWDGGAAWALRGPLAGVGRLADPWLTLLPTRADDRLGAGLAANFDLDGDGRLDLALGAPEAHGGASRSGRVFLILAPTEGSLEMTAASAVLDGDAADLRLGRVLTPGSADAAAPWLWLGLPEADQLGQVGWE